MSNDAIVVPVFGISGKFDGDLERQYGNAGDLYLALALGYDSMAAPAASRDRQMVWEADYSKMQPRLALSWNEEPSGDWIVNLRKGVQSHSGNEWCADNLAWAFQRALSHGTMASWRWTGVVGLEGIEVLDRYRVRFRLRTPFPTFPNWLLSITPNMVDLEAIRDHMTERDPDGTEWLDQNIAGFGPFQLDEVTGEHMLFSAHSGYWDAESEAKHVSVEVRSNRREAISELNDKRPVIIVGTDPDETIELMSKTDLIVQRAWSGHVTVDIDFTMPPFDELAVRHALAWATPYEEVRDVGLRTLAREWHGPAKGTSQWHTQSPLPYRFDLERSRSLLRATGYGDGITADLYLPRYPYCERIAEIIARTWHGVGVELVLKDVADAPPGWLPPLYLRTECGHNLSEPIYDVAHDYAAMNPILPPPGGPPNVGNWHPRWKKNPEVVQEFANLLIEKDPVLKRRKFDRLQASIVSFSSSIFLGEMQQTMVANRYVPSALVSPESRFFQALQYQNAMNHYLPPNLSSS